MAGCKQKRATLQRDFMASFRALKCFKIPSTFRDLSGFCVEMSKKCGQGCYVMSWLWIDNGFAIFFFIILPSWPSGHSKLENIFGSKTSLPPVGASAPLLRKAIEQKCWKQIGAEDFETFRNVIHGNCPIQGSLLIHRLPAPAFLNLKMQPLGWHLALLSVRPKTLSGWPAQVSDFDHATQQQMDVKMHVLDCFYCKLQASSCDSQHLQGQRAVLRRSRGGPAVPQFTHLSDSCCSGVT